MKQRYGANPSHLVIHVLLFALVGYAIVQIFALDNTGKILLWLAGAVVLHDAIMWPLYSGASTVTARTLGPLSNYLRIPLGLSLLVGLAFVSTITGKGESTYHHASGRGWDGYAIRWLIVTVALFLVSGVVALARGD